MTDVPRAVALNVRSRRAARGWSLDTLASRSGVSKGVLVALEQGRGNPSLGTLIRVAECLGLPITQLVEAGDTPAVRVVPVERQLTLWHGTAGGTGTLLASTDPPHAIELWRWDLRPGEVRESTAHAAGVRELVNVESGILRITVDDDVHRIPEGSSAAMPGDRRHSYAAEGPQATRFVLAVLVPPAS
ncbi:MAG: helix-turn-helix domain-containing protein [Acidimicrobiales bacterium]